MKGAMGYLVGTRLKNQLKSFKTHPSRLIYALVLVALFGLTLFSSGKQEAGSLRPGSEFALLAGAFFGMMFLILINSGFKNGASFFSLADVNFLFTAPVRPRNVLFYGLLRQLGVSLVMGIFLLFQYGWMHNVYGVRLPVLFLVLVCYGVTVFTAQVVAMLAYSLTSADEKKRRKLKSAVFGIFLLMAAAVVARAAVRDGFTLEALVRSANSPLFRLIPVAGWMSGVLQGAVEGNAGMIAFYAALSAAFLGIMVVAIVKTNHDFYEDVLKTTEASHSAITARKEGHIEDSAPGNVRVGKIGLGRGWGASAIYYKHRLENRRARRFLLPPLSLVYAAIVVAFALFTRDAGPIPVLVMAVYIQMFSEGLSRFSRELTKPYIYMIPESALGKMIHAMRETLLSGLAESALIFVVTGLLIHLDGWTIAAMVFVRWTFTLVFAAASVAEMRVFGGVTSKFLMIFFYLFLAVLMAAPGVIAAIVLGAFGHSLALCIAAAGVLNLPMALLALFLCRNMLRYAELNNI